MKHKDALLFIAGCLNNGLLREKRIRLAQDLRWDCILKIGDLHQVTAALGWCLRNHRSVPEAYSQYFKSILALNGRRNRRMLTAIEFLAYSLNRIGIQPVLLGGSAHIVDDLYPSLDLRPIESIDLLIPKSRLRDTIEAIRLFGLRCQKYQKRNYGYRHIGLARLLHTTPDISVRLHVADPFDRRVGLPEIGRLARSLLLEGSEPLAFRSSVVRIQSGTARAMHDILNAPFHHHGRSPTIKLLSLLDVHYLRRRYGGSLDWDRIRTEFQAKGHGPDLIRYLRYAADMIPISGMCADGIVRKLQMFGLILERDSIAGPESLWTVDSDPPSSHLTTANVLRADDTDPDADETRVLLDMNKLMAWRCQTAGPLEKAEISL